MSEFRNWEVKFFQTTRGTSPIEEFIRDQDESVYAKILRAILLLRNNGPYLKPPQMKKIEKGLYELKIKGRFPFEFSTHFLMTNIIYYIFLRKNLRKPQQKRLKLPLTE